MENVVYPEFVVNRINELIGTLEEKRIELYTTLRSQTSEVLDIPLVGEIELVRLEWLSIGDRLALLHDMLENYTSMRDAA
jgi:hypothetical protein